MMIKSKNNYMNWDRERLPLIFTPWMRSMVWGGNKISGYKHLDIIQEGIGESWELSAIPGHESVVEKGDLKGKTLAELVQKYKGLLVGEKVYEQYGDRFPLLVKLIDAHSDLSIQVHPNDEIAHKRHGADQFGKTEMWYVIDAEPGAYLYAGLKENITPDEYNKRVEEGSICEVLAKHEVHAGDVFHIPAGRIHAICSGILLAEIQQTSDITYRIFDYNRLGLDGKPRELHTEAAAEAIDYKVHSEYRIHYPNEKNKATLLIRCPFFSIRKVSLKRKFHRNMMKYDSFVICMSLKGDCKVFIHGNSEAVELKEGCTCLIPACLADYDVLPNNPENGVQLLEAFIDKKDCRLSKRLARFFHLAKK